jgi:hypothetical protein
MSASPIPEAKPLLRVKARVRTFLRNHAPDIAAMDPFVVPTIGFDLLYAYIIVRLDRRELVWISVTTHPTAEWVARQITEAFPWDEAPHYLIRDRDRRCRTADRIDPARVFGLRHRFGRGASASDSEILRPLLQRRQNASVFEQGRASHSLGTARRSHSSTRHPWRASPSLRPGLIFRHTQVSRER